LKELTIEIDGIDPLHLLGINNTKFTYLKKLFPTLRMVSRGNTIKAEGTDEDLAIFTTKIELLKQHIIRYYKLSEDDMERIVMNEISEKVNQFQNGILVHGNNGLVIRARTENQQRMVVESDKNDVLFAIGPAGTGKTYTAVALAVRALKERLVRKNNSN
jgi:phosphate starvation-inducible PhoH-like protein